ncbi:MAG: nitroreductase family protein [Spirochaetota bacterium]
MDLLPEISSRFSVREYKDTPVPQDSLDRIIEAGRRAPSAKNRQPWRFIAVLDGEKRMRLQDACFGQEWVGNAPVGIAICSTNIDYKMPNGQLSYPVDLSIAASFMMIQAVHEGLGTCLNTTFDEQDVKSLLSVPYSMRVVMLLTLGYSDAKQPHAERLPLDRVFSIDHW